MLKKPRTILYLTAAILLGMLLGSAARTREHTAAVTAVLAEEIPIYNSVTASGTIEAEHSYAFTAQENAVVGDVYCRNGETVQKGQALWQLRPAEGLEWTAGLLQGTVSALTAWESSERVPSEAGVVLAPEDCTLLAAPSVGQAAPAGLPYAQAAAAGALQLRVNIAEAFVADVKAGQRANITVLATDGTYAGRVQSVSPVARQAVSLTGSAGAVTVSAVLEIQGADETLRPGYSASAKIFVDEKEAAVVLPYEAIRQEGREEYVYVIGADRRAHRRTIRTGYALSQAVEITEGVAAGETVITEASEPLSEGLLVEVQP